MPTLIAASIVCGSMLVSNPKPHEYRPCVASLFHGVVLPMDECTEGARIRTQALELKAYRDGRFSDIETHYECFPSDSEQAVKDSLPEFAELGLGADATTILEYEWNRQVHRFVPRKTI